VYRRQLQLISPACVGLSIRAAMASRDKKGRYRGRGTIIVPAIFSVGQANKRLKQF
jgi:hypothetical protein